MALPHGQGKPLPPNFPYQGEWVLEPIVFLHHPDAQSLGGDAPRFTALVTNSDGTFSRGFDAGQLAAALGVEIVRVFAANQSGDLIIRGTSDASDFHGTSAVRFHFQLGDKEAALVVEEPRTSGSA
jgi:hypothetical protein